MWFSELRLALIILAERDFPVHEFNENIIITNIVIENICLKFILFIEYNNALYIYKLFIIWFSLHPILYFRNTHNTKVNLSYYNKISIVNNH